MNAAIANAVVSAHGLRKAYKNKLALNDTSFQIEAGKIIGLIALDGKSRNQFNEHHSALAVTFANQLAIALENSRLFSELQNELEKRRKLIAELEIKNAESETLRESVAIVAATLEKSEAVDRILEDGQHEEALAIECPHTTKGSEKLSRQQHVRLKQPGKPVLR